MSDSRPVAMETRLGLGGEERHTRTRTPPPIPRSCSFGTREHAPDPLGVQRVVFLEHRFPTGIRVVGCELDRAESGEPVLPGGCREV